MGGVYPESGVGRARRAEGSGVRIRTKLRAAGPSTIQIEQVAAARYPAESAVVVPCLCPSPRANFAST